jgi:hypothetical protein
VDGKIIYRRFSQYRFGYQNFGIYFYDTDKREEKTIIGNRQWVCGIERWKIDAGG